MNVSVQHMLSGSGMGKSVTLEARVRFRSYKGSNIALMIELLAGPLVGGAVQDKLGSKNWGNLMIALNPSALGDPGTIMHNVQLMLGRVKGARKAAGVQEIMLPGERGNRLAGTSLSNSISQQLPLEHMFQQMQLHTCISVCKRGHVSAHVAQPMCQPCAQ